jgi:hypothetical protein
LQQQQRRPEAEIVRGNSRTYDATVRKNADFNQDQYDHALRTAAAQGKAVILVFGSSRSPASVQELDSLAQTKKQVGDRAVIVHIDVDKVDPRSRIGQYVNQEVRPRGVPFTMVFDQKMDQNGNPVPQKPVDYFTGSAERTMLSRRLAISVDRVGQIRQWGSQQTFNPYQSQRDLYNFYDPRVANRTWRSTEFEQNERSNYYRQPYRYPVHETNCNSPRETMQCNGGQNYQRHFAGCRVLSFAGRVFRRCR